jgi:hypothetical protein
MEPTPVVSELRYDSERDSPPAVIVHGTWFGLQIPIELRRAGRPQ